MSTRGRDPTPRGQTQLPNHGSGLQAAARPGILNRRDLRQKCQKSDSSPGLESAGKPRASSLGHPGLPCGLWKMTCPEVEDRPPKLLPQVSLAPAVRASSPGLTRSRLQLTPATSPKLEQYLIVTTSDPAAVSQLAAAPDLASGKPCKAAAAASPGARNPSSAPSPSAKPESVPASASPQAAGEKKTKRDSLTRKSSPRC